MPTARSSRSPASKPTLWSTRTGCGDATVPACFMASRTVGTETTGSLAVWAPSGRIQAARVIRRAETKSASAYRKAFGTQPLGFHARLAPTSIPVRTYRCLRLVFHFLWIAAGAALIYPLVDDSRRDSPQTALVASNPAHPGDPSRPRTDRRAARQPDRRQSRFLARHLRHQRTAPVGLRFKSEVRAAVHWLACGEERHRLPCAAAAAVTPRWSTRKIDGSAQVG